MKARVGTALVLGSAFFLSLWLGSLSVLGIWLFGAGACLLWEFDNLGALPLSERLWSQLWWAVFWLLSVLHLPLFWILFWHVFFFQTTVLRWWGLSGERLSQSLLFFSHAFLGKVFYALPLWFFWQSFERGASWEELLWFLTVIWASDTVAFFVGKSMGKHALSPLSPQKSWEGAVGGFLAALSVSFLWTFFSSATLPSLKWAVLIAGSGLLGDLFESAWKRKAAVKESSSLLRGHGGVLDRLDSMSFAAWWFVLWHFFCS